MLGDKEPTYDHVELASLVQFVDVDLAIDVEAMQLTDIQTPLFVPADSRRLSHQWLTGDDIEPVSLGDLDALRALFRRLWLGSIVGYRDLSKSRDNASDEDR